MLSSFSSNAVLSKARAMYGKRLTAENYRDLLNCRTVGEVAAVLKSRTSYGTVLAGINENEIHRGILEAELKKTCSGSTLPSPGMKYPWANISPAIL